MSRLAYSVPEAAAAIGISATSYYEGIKRGDLPHLRINGRIVVPKVALADFLAKASA